MKQLKVLKTDLNLNKGSIVHASFNESITIRENSRIWLDKLAMVVLSNTPNGISIDEQGILISTNHTTDATFRAYRTIVFPSGRYQTIQDVLSTLNNVTNAMLNSNPVQLANFKPTDIGLSILWTQDPTTKKIVCAYEGVDVKVQTDGVLSDCTITPDTGFNYILPNSDTSDYSAIYPTPLIRGGLVCEFKMEIPSDLEDNVLEVGMFDGPTAGANSLFTVALINGEWFFSRNGVLSATTSPIFSNATASGVNNYYAFYIDPTDPGLLRFGAFNVQTHVILGSSPVGQFTGFNFTTPLYFQVRGNANNSVEYVKVGEPFLTYPTLSVDNRGHYQDLTKYISPLYVSPVLTGNQSQYPSTPQPALFRTMAIDFTNAQFLSTGLGFQSLTYQNNGFQNSFISESFQSFTNYFDLALSILNLPLESYISSDDESGRQNTLAYFTPQRSDLNSSNTYIYEARTETFLDLNNKVPLQIESLSFRIYNVQEPNSTFQVSSLSFNIFIEDGKEDKPY
jgi:hypothetical protein